VTAQESAAHGRYAHDQKTGEALMYDDDKDALAA